MLLGEEGVKRLIAPKIEQAAAEGLGESFNVGREGAVLLKRTNVAANLSNGFSDGLRGLEREAIFERLSGAQKFDGEELFGVVDDLAELEGGGHAHGDVVFFAAGGGYGVRGGWVGKDFGFVEQSGGHNVRQHKAGGNARGAGEERGQSFIDVGIDEAVDAALGDSHEGGEGHGRGIEGQSQGGAVEIAAGEDLALRRAI